MHMTKPQAVILSKLLGEIRPDWDFHGCMAALAKAADKGSLSSVAIAAITAAADPGAHTPAVIPMPGHHWQTWGVTAEVTRRTRSHDRCVLDELAHMHQQHDPDAAHRGYLAARAALTQRPKETP